MNDLTDGPRRELTGIGQHHSGDTLVLTLAGDLAADAGPPLFDLVDAWLGGRLRHIVLDLAGVEFIDVAGLRVLLRARRNCADHHVTLRIENPPPHLIWLATVTGTTPLLLEGHGHDDPKARQALAAEPDERQEPADHRDEQLRDREMLADERDKLLDERAQQIRGRQEWQDIREDLADERELDLERREQHD